MFIFLTIELTDLTFFFQKKPFLNHSLIGEKIVKIKFLFY